VIEKRLQGPANPSILRALEAIREIEGYNPDDAILLAHLRHQVDLLLADAVRAAIEEEL
jgi:hypothetical protein